MLPDQSQKETDKLFYRTFILPVPFGNGEFFDGNPRITDTGIIKWKN